MRSTVNLSLGEFDAIRRLEVARRELAELADALIGERTSRRDRRHELGRRANAVRASLQTVLLSLAPEEETDAPPPPS